MLTGLKVDNFKAWKELQIDFGKVTGIFGTNSSGKSSILQFLLLLKQTRDATDHGLVLDFGGEGELVDLGTLRDVVHNWPQAKVIRGIFEWKLSKPLKIYDSSGRPGDILFEDDTIMFGYSVGLRGRRLWLGSLAYILNDTIIAFDWNEAKKKFEFKIEGDGKIEPVRDKEKPWDLPKPIKNYRFPDEVRNYYINMGYLGNLEFEYEKLMDSIYYLGPLREYPRRLYQWVDSYPATLGSRGQYAVEAIIGATMKEEVRSLGPRRKKMPFQEIIAYWLKQMGLIHQFRLKKVIRQFNMYQALVQKTPNSQEVSLTDVGFGVSQVLPILVLLYYVPENSVVLLEQPEIHLHPSAQSELADVILNVAQTRNVQVVVESHSEHLLRRIQRRVAEEKVEPEHIKIYFTSIVDGAAQIEDIGLNELGEIERWPENFFGDELGEVAKIIDAGLRRKIGDD